MAEIVETGQKVQLTAEVYDALGKKVTNPRVTWESMDPTVALVNSLGTVTGMHEGVAEVRGTYAGLSSTAVVAVSRRKISTEGSGESVTVYPDADTIPAVGGTTKLLAVGRNNGGHLVSGNRLGWTTESEVIATVDADGVVTGRKTGHTRVLVHNGSAVDTSEVWVAPSDVAVAIEVTPAADTIPALGGTIDLVAKVTNGSNEAMPGLDIGWRTLDDAIATVSGGRVQGLSQGVARIVAWHKTFADTARVWVAPEMPPTSLYVEPRTDTLKQVGETVSLKATLMDGNGAPVSQSVTWSTTDPAVAAVTQNGLVKGLARGFARIVARHDELVDTAKIWVSPDPLFTVSISPATASVEVDGTVHVDAVVNDDQNAVVESGMATWSSLDASIAVVNEAGPAHGTDVRGVAEGTARIVATYSGAADTAVVTVTKGSTGPSVYRSVIRPNPATIDSPGQQVRVTWDAWDQSGTELLGLKPSWQSLDPSVVTAPTTDGPVADLVGVAPGTAKVIATWQGVSDTVTVVVNGTTGGTGGTSARVQVNPALDTIPVIGGTAQLNASATDASGSPVSPGLVTWSTLDPATATVNASGLVTGLAQGSARIVATYSGASDTARVVVSPPPPPPPGTRLTPSNLMPMLGPIVARDPNTSIPHLAMYDQRYMQNEYARFQDYLNVENDPGGAYLNANHYGGLRQRLAWAIRTGEAWGPGVADESRFAYARGLRIVRRYLQYSKVNKFVVPVQNNTGLADIELLYRLEGDPDALTHIHITAAFYTLDPYHYLTLQNSSSGARIPAIALQAFNAAHRLGIPYGRNSANLGIAVDNTIGSWKEAGERLIGWFDQYNVIQPNGAIFTPSNNGDTYFMDAMLASQLLEWCVDVQWNAQAFDQARRIMDHLISEVKPGWSSLGYLDTSGSPAPDLAAFFIWPSLVMWQETGDSKYHDFAMFNLAASTQAYVFAPKQFNQVYSTLGQDLEALISGQRWH